MDDRKWGYGPNWVWIQVTISDGIATVQAELDKVKQICSLVQAKAGDDRSAPWDAEAEATFYRLLANVREG